MRKERAKEGGCITANRNFDRDTASPYVLGR